MITIFANPASGASLGKRTLQIVKEYLDSKNQNYEVYQSSFEGEPVEIARNYKDQVKKIILICKLLFTN